MPVRCAAGVVQNRRYSASGQDRQGHHQNSESDWPMPFQILRVPCPKLPSAAWHLAGNKSGASRPGVLSARSLGHQQARASLFLGQPPVNSPSFITGLSRQHRADSLPCRSSRFHETDREASFFAVIFAAAFCVSLPEAQPPAHRHLDISASFGPLRTPVRPKHQGRPQQPLDQSVSNIVRLNLLAPPVTSSSLSASDALPGLET